jgi:hypothetical protein
MRRLPLVALAAALVVPTLTACQPDTVRVSFQPREGTTYGYIVDVTAETLTELEGEEPRRQRQEVRLVEEQTVLDAGASGVRVRVFVGEPGSTGQSFVVTFDENAQLRSIDAAEDASPDIAGAVGVAEIFPGAAGTPDRRVGPGVRWSTDRAVSLPGLTGDGEDARIRTTGRFVEFAVDGDRRLARVESTTELPLRSETETLTVEGTETIRQVVTYDVADGSVHEATATTTGRFRIIARPPAGTDAEPVPGTLTLSVRSVTRRQR